MKVIGITGTLGAGKGTVVKLIQEIGDFTHISARQMIIDTGKSLGVDIINRDDMRDFADEYNKTSSFISDFVNRYKNEAEDKSQNYIFESIRRVKEIENFKNLLGDSFILLSIDADIKVRYDRIYNRGTSTDDVTFEEFKIQEEKENGNNQENKMNLKECIEMSNIKINNSKNLSDLKSQVENIKIKYPEFFI